MAEFECYAILIPPGDEKRMVNLGYAYVVQNKSKAIKLQCEIGDRIYDKGCTNLVKDDQVYAPYRDFIILGENKRYYLCKATYFSCDLVDADTDYGTIPSVNDFGKKLETTSEETDDAGAASGTDSGDGPSLDL